MKKSLQVQALKNGLILHVLRKDRTSEGFIVADDGSEAFRQFQAAFDACEEQAIEAGNYEENDSEPHSNEYRDEPQYRHEGVNDDLAAFIGRAVNNGLRWVEENEKTRHSRRKSKNRR